MRSIVSPLALEQAIVTTVPLMLEMYAPALERLPTQPPTMCPSFFDVYVYPSVTVNCTHSKSGYASTPSTNVAAVI
jgi:hypothetical protein